MGTPSSKEQLEVRKIELEISQLTLSWWKRPAYIAALVPTVVALVSVLAAFLTGVFDARQAEIDASVKLLKAEQLSLELKTSELRSQESTLTQEISAFEARKQTLEAEVETQERRLRQAKFRIPLNALLSTDEVVDPYHSLIPLLIENLRQEDPSGEGESIIVTAIERQPGGQRGLLVKGILLRVLYLGTQKDEYLLQLHDLTKRIVAGDYSSNVQSDLSWYWNIFGNDWPIDARRRNATLLSSVLTSDGFPREATPEIMLALAETLESTVLVGEFHKQDSCQEIVTFARDIVLDKSLDSYDRSNALGLLAVLYPSIAVFAIGEIVINEFENLELMYILEEDVTYSESLSEEVKRLGAPGKAVHQLWSKWLESHSDGRSRVLGEEVECESMGV